MNKVKEVSGVYGIVFKQYFWVNADEENEAISYVEEYVERPVETLIYHSDSPNHDAIYYVISNIIEDVIGNPIFSDRYKHTYKLNKQHILEALKK